MVTVVMAMIMVRVAVFSDNLCMRLVTMLMLFLFLFVTVAVIMVFSEVGVLVEESHSDNINDKSDDSYYDHLAGMDNRRVVDSLKRFNKDVETDKNEEDSVDEARKGLESIESIGEFTVSRESCLVRGIYTYCEGCGVEEHMGRVREEPDTV